MYEVPNSSGYRSAQRELENSKNLLQDTFKKVELIIAPKTSGSVISRPSEPSQETMSISDIDHRPKNVEQKAEPVEPVKKVPLNSDELEKTMKIGTKLTLEERTELLEFLKGNRDVFAWTIDEMPGIPTEFAIHKLSTDPTKKPVVQKRRLVGLEKQVAIDEEISQLLQACFIRRVEYSKWVSNPMLVKKPNGKWRMCIDFTNLNEACPKDPHPLPNVQLWLDDQEKMAFYAGDAIYCYVMMPFGLKNAGTTYQKLVQVIFKLQIGRNIEVYVDDMIITSLRGKFLGYVVSKKGIEVNLEKVEAMQQMESPKTIKDVKRQQVVLPLYTDSLLDPSDARLIRHKAAHFTLIKDQLYKRVASTPLLCCLTPYEAKYAVREVHEGVCGTHIGGKTLARKILRHGYYWPTMVEDAQNYVKKCPTCQFNTDDIHMPEAIVSCITMAFRPMGSRSAQSFYKGQGRFGIPMRIIADNGPQFQAVALKSFCDDYNIELTLIYIFHSQTDKQNQRIKSFYVVLRRVSWRHNLIGLTSSTKYYGHAAPRPTRPLVKLDSALPVELRL
ncbi:hypothetical protein SLEP1_g39469 [Rubroshorea leprosula]|uniref:Integrase zinc-binding domain-containing protein n=1 Tax=Rubroshorea leprosula TaxID=152421 RepID=A0AAV5L104_9ROSI|nr:hypothetical protein SLEP1_g39469 [Rubroshorea leprosula]